MQTTIPIPTNYGKQAAGAKPKSFVFTSGKGGVGKTNLAANTAIAMARLNRRVAIFDADLGLANIDVLLGIKPRYTLRHVIYGRKKLKEIMVDGPEGVSIIPGGSGIRELVTLTPDERERCMASFAELQGEYDTVIVDTSAGISPNVLSFLFGGDEIVLITTSEPTALTDAYALIKVVSREQSSPRISLLVNMAPNEDDAVSTSRKIQLVAANFLNLRIDYLGYVPNDEEVAISVKAQVPLLARCPDSRAARAISVIARKLCNGTRASADYGSNVLSVTK